MVVRGHKVSGVVAESSAAIVLVCDGVFSPSICCAILGNLLSRHVVFRIRLSIRTTLTVQL